MIKELSVKEDKNLVNIIGRSKTLILIMIFSQIFLFLGLRYLALFQLEGCIDCFFDELLLDSVLYLLNPFVLRGNNDDFWKSLIKS